MADVGFVSKLTLKKMGVNPQDGAKKDTPLARIYGFVSGIKIGTNPNNGDAYTALQGDFEGENLQTGEMFRSGILFLPGGIHETLTSPFDNLKEGEEAPRIKFGFTINAFPATNKIGYSYKAIPFVQPNKDDALVAMRAEAKAAPKQIAQGGKK